MQFIRQSFTLRACLDACLPPDQADGMQLHGVCLLAWTREPPLESGLRETSRAFSMGQVSKIDDVA